VSRACRVEASERRPVTPSGFRVTRLASPVTPFSWRLAGLDFFGTPGSIDQISRSDQEVFTLITRIALIFLWEIQFVRIRVIRVKAVGFFFAPFAFFVVQILLFVPASSFNPPSSPPLTWSSSPIKSRILSLNRFVSGRVC
jgi:hypothetical protein